MAQTTLDTRVSSQMATLVRFEWGDGETALYTTSASQVVVASGSMAGTYAPEPRMRAERPQKNGGLDPQRGTVEIPSFREPMPGLLSGFPFPPVRVVLGHVDPSSVAATVRRLDVGNVEIGTKAALGASGLARVEFVGVKALLQDFPLGVFTSPTCEHVFGGAGCGVDAGALVATGEIAAVGATSANEISVTWDGTPPDLTIAGRWRRGYIKILGDLRIVVRDVYSASPDRIRLARIPNPAWVGEAFTLHPGCDQQVATCRDVYDNLENRLALGQTIPPYNPSATTE